jgi:hypothetical protein
MKNTKLIEMIEDMPVAKGKKELLAHLDGKTLTLKQQIISKCYDCMGYYQDGKIDCGISACALYSSMPYNPNKTVKKRVMTDEQRKQSGERLKSALKRRG